MNASRIIPSGDFTVFKAALGAGATASLPVGVCAPATGTLIRDIMPMPKPAMAILVNDLYGFEGESEFVMRKSPFFGLDLEDKSFK